MKTLKKNLLDWFLLAASFMIGISILWILAYNVYAALSTASTGSPLTAANYNDIINKINTLENTISTQNSTIASINSIPSWSIIAFNSSSCPTGWSKANGTNGTIDLRGEFIRWFDDWKWIDSWRTLGSNQFWSLILWEVVDNVASFRRMQNMSNYFDKTTDTTSIATAAVWWGITNITANSQYIWVSRPRNIALLYCIKN